MENNSSSEEDNEELFDELYNEAVEAMTKNDIDELNKLLTRLFELEEWHNDIYNYFTYDLMETAVKNNNITMIEYLLNKFPYQDISELCQKLYKDRLLHIIFNEAAVLGNYELCLFVLNYDNSYTFDDHSIYTFEFNSNELDSALKGKNKQIIELVLNSNKFIAHYRGGYLKTVIRGANITLKLAEKIDAKYVNRILNKLKEAHIDAYNKIILDQI